VNIRSHHNAVKPAIVYTLFYLSKIVTLYEVSIPVSLGGLNCLDPVMESSENQREACSLCVIMLKYCQFIAMLPEMND